MHWTLVGKVLRQDFNWLLCDVSKLHTCRVWTILVKIGWWHFSVKWFFLKNATNDFRQKLMVDSLYLDASNGICHMSGKTRFLEIIFFKVESFHKNGKNRLFSFCNTSYKDTLNVFVTVLNSTRQHLSNGTSDVAIGRSVWWYIAYITLYMAQNEKFTFWKNKIAQVFRIAYLKNDVRKIPWLKFLKISM